MGNRCLIVPKGENIGVYLHWNGGIDSVTAFLKYCEYKGYRGFDADYGIARFCQVVGNWFGGGLSLGIMSINESLEEASQGLDNGVYVVEGWEIVERIGNRYAPEGYDLTEMLISIDEAQPVKEQIGKEFFTTEEVEPTDLNIGDKFYYYDAVYGEYSIETIVGLGRRYGDMIDFPYMDKYQNQYCGEEINPNNFIRGKVRRIKKEFEEE